MNIKQILKNAGLEENVVDSLAETINAQIDTMQEQLNDFEAKANNVKEDEYKAKYEALTGEFDQYKADIENKEVLSTKSSLLKNKLKESGISNPKLVDLLAKEFDVNSLEVEENNIKDWDNILNPIKENYSDFFAVETTSGTEPNTPPTNNPSGIDPFLAGFDS